MPLPASLANTLELPVVGSPLFIVSGPELVIAQCKAGDRRLVSRAERPSRRKTRRMADRIENELGEYKALHPQKKVAPYAVNQICHASNDRLMKDMETCVKHKVPIIITSLRPPIRNRRSRAFLWRRGFPRRDQRQACAQGRGAWRRRPHSGLRRRRRPCRHAVAVRAAARGQAVVQGHHPAVGRDLRWLGHCVRARARRRHGLHRHALHRDRRSQRRPGLQGRADQIMPPRTSSIPTCSPACTATISAPRSWPPASIPTICRSATSRR